MVHSGPRAFRRRLRRLDRRTFVRFVASLWTARGWRAEVGRRRIVVRKDSTGGKQVLAVVGSYRGAARALARPQDDVDVVVTSLSAPVVRALRRRCGVDADVVGPAGLRERLVYGSDGDVRRRLEDQFLAGGSPMDRRAVLSAVAVGLGAAFSGGLAPTGSGTSATPTLRYVLERTGENAGRTASRGPEGDTYRGPPSSTLTCDVSPRERLAGQVAALLRRQVDSDAATLVTPELVVPDLDLTGPFLVAVRSAGLRPFDRARSVRVGTAFGDGGQVLVPVTVVTESDDVVLYEFALVSSGDGCWRTTDARIADRQNHG